MRSALVFGGSGQIGVPVIERLLDAGWQVSAVSRAAQSARDGIRWLRGDLQEFESPPASVDAIFSLGPLDHFARWYASTSVAAPRVVAFGSTSVWTKQESRDAEERDLAMRLRQAEASLFAAAQNRGAGATVLRPTLVYGAGRDKTLSQIALLARRGGFFVLPASARGLRQPVHVDDLAAATLAVVDAAVAHGHGYDLPGGETLAYAQMVERALAAMRPPAKLRRVPDAMFNLALSTAHLFGKLGGLGDAAVSRMAEDLVFDIAPAVRDFGYSPRPFNPDASMLPR